MDTSYENIAQSIINAHPESVRLLLASKGITKPATPEVLKNTYRLLGKPWLADLVTIISKKANPTLSNVTGDEVPAVITAGVEKKTIFDKLTGIFDSVNTVVQTVKSFTTPKPIIDPKTGKVITADEKAALDKAADDKQAKTMLIIGGLIIVTLILLFVIFKKKKS